MKYLIIGAGGTGGVVGYYMTKAGKDVTLIARGAHLKQMQTKGLILEKMWDQSTETITVKASDMGHYTEQPDVILVCVKGYSLADTIPFIQKVAKKDTVVIPILNIYGTGAKMQKELSELLVTDGCIYVSANIKEPGVLLQHGKILKVVFGVREKEEYRPVLKEIEKDLCDSSIYGVLSENIRRDALEKFSYVSPIGAAGLYYHATAGDFQKEGEQRETFKAMIREIAALADAMGVPFEKDMVDVNLRILENLAPEATTSMQRDVYAGKSSEIDGLVYEVVRMGQEYGVAVPVYEKVAEKLGGIKEMSLEKAKAYLAEKGYADHVIELEDSSATVQLAAQALGVEPGMIAKTMSFLIGEEAILILTEGTARVDNRKYKDTFHMKAKMIPFEEVENWIGHAPGGVCPFGIKEGVKVYLDESLKQFDTVYPAAGNDHSAVKLTIAELEEVAGAVGWVDVCKEPA